MNKLAQVSFSMLREIKKANNGRMLLYDLFFLEQQINGGQIVICNKDVLFIRSVDCVEIYENSFCSHLVMTQQYLIFIAPLERNFENHILSLLKTYNLDYQWVKEDVDFQKNLPFEIARIIEGDIGNV